MISIGEPIVQNGQDLLAEFTQYGHQKPFEELTRRYAGMVFNVCLRVTKDKHDAEDATQAVFLTLALQAKRGNEIKAIGPWLQQVAKRLSLDIRRSKKRRKTREERHHDEQTLRRGSITDTQPLPAADLDEMKGILHEELDKLPAKYRLPLILHYFGGLNRDEMAVELKCKPSTLGVRIFRGREMLAGRLNGRGVSISLATFPALMAYTIKSAINHAMISSTSQAASALAGGHAGIGLVSARVIGLTRRAASAVAISKLKLAAMVLILAASSLGAGAKALGMLPTIDVRQIITHQLQRLLRPLVEPLSIPLRVDAAPAIRISAGTQLAAAPAVEIESASIVPHQSRQITASVIEPYTLSVAASPPPAVVAAPATGLGFSRAAEWSTAVAVHSAPDAAPALAHADQTSHASDNVPIASPVISSNTNSASSNIDSISPLRRDNDVVTAKSIEPMTTGPAMTASAASDLSVGPAAGGSGAVGLVADGLNITPATSTPVNSTATFGALAMPANAGVSVAAAPAASTAVKSGKIIRIPVDEGSVTLSDGVLRGWGKISRTGTLNVSGKVVADGQGIDRTLDLTSFKTVQGDADPTSASGWYAKAGGRLVLPLQPSANGCNLTWGENPDNPTLNLVNSVRLRPQVPSAAQSVELALLATDRKDVPPLTDIAGLPISLWKVDGDNLGATNLAVRYDNALVAALGDSESSVQLWTYDAGDWQTVDPASFALDTTDHLVSGSAADFSYFAVTVPLPLSPVADVSTMVALPDDERAIPEPAGLTLLLMTGSLLLCRRRTR